MIDQNKINNYKRYTFIGADWKSGYNMSNKYMIKYDNDIRQYYVFPAGRILNRIYVFQKGQAIDESRTVVAYMLAYEDTDLPLATRQEIFDSLPAEIQNYLKEHEAPEPEPEQPAVYTAIKTTDEQQAAAEVYTAIKTDTEPEPAEQKPKHKGGRPRTREETGRRYIRLWINDEEHAEIKKLIAKLRGKS